MKILSRRRFLRASLTAPGALAATRVAGMSQAGPSIVASDRMRPATPSGLQVGDVSADRAVIWCRADRPARLIVERAFREDFTGSVRIRGPVALEPDDFIARLDLTALEPDRDVFVRVTFEDLDIGRTSSAPLEGRFRSAPASRRNVRFVWSGDTAGQGFGINPDWGGMRTYETMRQVRPDFFIHCGDTIYADGPIQAAVTLEDGTVWRNLVTEETGKVAESLREFRGRHAYNLLDEHVRRFAAEVPQVWLWDDHEVVNNWSESTDLSQDSRYSQKSVRLLSAYGARAFFDYAPMRQHGADDAGRIYRRVAYGPLLDVFALDARSYRGRNSHNRQNSPGPETALFGAQQIEWLQQELSRSRALWKVIASDMPIGVVVGDGRDREGRLRFDAVANGDGPPLGRELELAGLLRFLKRQRIRNVFWITADVHYTAAHWYDPSQARFDDFDPFWEFVSGPLNAGSFGPNPLDDTFGPQVRYVRAPPRPNAPPSAGFQFFGQVDIEGTTGLATVTLKDVAGASLWQTSLAPEV